MAGGLSINTVVQNGRVFVSTVLPMVCSNVLLKLGLPIFRCPSQNFSTVIVLEQIFSKNHRLRTPAFVKLFLNSLFFSLLTNIIQKIQITNALVFSVSASTSALRQQNGFLEIIDNHLLKPICVFCLN